MGGKLGRMGGGEKLGRMGGGEGVGNRGGWEEERGCEDGRVRQRIKGG